MMLQEGLGADGKQMALCDDAEVRKSNQGFLSWLIPAGLSACVLV